MTLETRFFEHVIGERGLPEPDQQPIKGEEPTAHSVLAQNQGKRGRYPGDFLHFVPVLLE